MTSGYNIEIGDLARHFRRRDGSLVRAIDGIDLEVAAGEFVVLLGASGCGKTTLLRAIAGLEGADRGFIGVGGRRVFDAATRLVVPPEKRRIGMMFQSYALWPHMTILENIRFPLKMQGADQAEMTQKVDRVVDMMNLRDLLAQHPNQLSGGQQQRVALARAMVCSEKLVLFDEPLSNVDAKVREHLRTELGLMQRELGFTAVYVTHDQEEAMALADRIVILGGGKIWQTGTPDEVYATPRDARVAAFVGSANILSGRVIVREAQVEVDCAFGLLRLPADRVKAVGTEVAIVTRPEDWRFGEAAGAVSTPGVVRLVTNFGPHRDYIVDVAGNRLRVRSSGSIKARVGEPVVCSIDPADLQVLDHNADEVAA
jgi:iron(III) transport system ATP-binding protein